MAKKIQLPGGAPAGDLEAAIRAAGALLRKISPGLKFRVLIDDKTNAVIDGRRVKEALPGSQVHYETIETDAPDLVRHVLNLMSRPITPDQRAMTAVVVFLDVVRKAAQRNRELGTKVGPENQAGDTRDVLRFLAGGIARNYVENAMVLWGTPHGDLVDHVLQGQRSVADARLAARARDYLPEAKAIFEDDTIDLTRREREEILGLKKATAERLTAKALGGEHAADVVRAGLRKSRLGRLKTGAKVDPGRDVRLTPTDIVEAIRWSFDGQIAFDAASSWSNPTGADRFAALDTDEPTDGSMVPWPDRTFVNPPYSHRSGNKGPGGIDEFIENAIRMRDADHMPRIYLLLPVHPDSAAGQRALSECTDALFLANRLPFDRLDGAERVIETGTANMANVIVAFNTTTLTLVELMRENDGKTVGVVMSPNPRPKTRWTRAAEDGAAELTNDDWRSLSEAHELEEAQRDHEEVLKMLATAEIESQRATAAGREKVAHARKVADAAKKTAKKSHKKS